MVVKQKKKYITNINERNFKKIIDKLKLENNIEQIALYDLENNNIFGCSY